MGLGLGCEVTGRGRSGESRAGFGRKGKERAGERCSRGLRGLTLLSHWGDGRLRARLG